MQVGDEVSGQTVVSQGLSGSETVVVSGQSRLAPGTRDNGDRRIEGCIRVGGLLPEPRFPDDITHQDDITHEYFDAFHSAADRHVFDDRGDFPRRAGGLPLLPVAPLPNVQFPTLTVTAQYPGASPETMASTIATPLETQFGQMLPGLSQMTSASVMGTTQITLQFGLGNDLRNDETLVLEAINAAQGSLPKNMPSPPTFRAINPADSPIMILAMQSDQAPITDVDSYAENIVEQQISQLPGVGQVLVGGQQTPAIRVQVDPARLANMGMTMEDVRTVLTNITVDDPKGSIDGQNQSYTIYANDQLTKAEPYNNVIIGYRNGAAIRSAGCRSSGRRAAKSGAGGMDERKAVGPAAGVQAAQRQRYRHRRRGKGQVAVAAGGHPAGHSPGRRVRPHADNPRIGK